jgi:hypothetical protein
MLTIAISAGAAGFLGWRLVGHSPEEAITAVLRKRLSFLQLDAAGVRQFAADFANNSGISAGKLRLVNALGPIYGRLSLSHHDWLEDNVRHGEEHIVGTYLLSTDFFQNGANEDRVVRYTGLYDPLRACNNPFYRQAVPAAG